VKEGDSFVELVDAPPLRRVAGDVVIFPQGDAHLMNSEPGLPPARDSVLCRCDAPLARNAEDVGNQTDTAFSRAFRREFGSPPATWRRSQGARPHAS